ncbi:IS4 family transposase [Serratia symbiotica]|uniref:IS4 family transposase n=1 Tax=Serratia symbiotica TaxID=138074 RepID=UPI00077BBB0D|nr:IS4 family transposase [Serratia symbiotica]
MHLSQALGIINITAPEQVQTLADLLPPDLIQQAFSLTDTVTLRKRKLPLESMVWLVIGMAIYNNRPLSQIVNLMDIVDRTGRPFTAPSSVIQRRKTLGEDPIKTLFKLTADYWHQEARHPLWHGLKLLGVDGVVWRTPDTPENEAAFGKSRTQHGDTAYPHEEIRKLGRQDRLVKLKTSPQSRKQWDGLPEEVIARLIVRTIKGKEREVLTSLTDTMRYPAADVSELYQHRWEIELGYWEVKQELLGNRWTLRSKLPEMVRQELWGVLLTYNLVRYQMVKMAFNLKGDYLPYQLSFSGTISEILRLLIGLPLCSAGAVPGHLKYFYELAGSLVLPGRRERSYPRELKSLKRKYPIKNNAGHLK